MILYIEPFSGLSGDMFLSGLCELADGFDLVTTLPEKLNLPDGRIEIETLNKNGIVCKHVKISDLNSKAAKHHHHHHHGHHHHHHFSDYLKMGFSKIAALFGREKAVVFSNGHSRGLKEINEIIDKGNISEGAKRIARDIFHIIGLSESKIHQMPLETIHFHEVSGVDSILDIVGCAVMLDRLEIEKTYSESVCTGYGMVNTQHGILPVPAPATADILKGIPTYRGEEKGEKVTPTGAAILKYLKPDFSAPSVERKQIAYGPGQKDFKYPNVLRLSLVELVKESEKKKPDLKN